MELLMVLFGFIVLNVAVALWGGDSRDGKDWRRGAAGPTALPPNSR